MEAVAPIVARARRHLTRYLYSSGSGIVKRSQRRAMSSRSRAVGS